MTLGDLIFKYRTENELSMDDFSKKSGISKAYVSLIEKNVNPRNNKPVAPTLPTLKKIASAMNMDIDSLLKSLGNEQEISLTNDNNMDDEIKELVHDVSINEDLKLLLEIGKKMTPEQLSTHIEFLKKLYD